MTVLAETTNLKFAERHSPFPLAAAWSEAGHPTCES
jgi:hypothetical protein